MNDWRRARLGAWGLLTLLAIDAGGAMAVAAEAVAQGDVGRLQAALGAVYARSPVLFIGAGVALVTPILAMVALLVRRRLAVRPRRDANHAVGKRDIMIGRRAAWIEAPDANGALRHRLDGELVRIGRERDNDIRLQDDTIHRYHAIIQRYDEGFVVHDVSGEDGNGVTVNGRRLAAAALVDGDRLGLGRLTLTFGSTLEAPQGTRGQRHDDAERGKHDS